MVNLRLPWPPSVNQCYRSYKGRYLLSKKGREFKKSGKAELMVQKAPQGLNQRLRVNIDAYPPDRRKRDLDNLLKPVLDVLQDYGVFDDDEQIDILRIRRMNIEKPGYVRVYISDAD